VIVVELADAPDPTMVCGDPSCTAAAVATVAVLSLPPDRCAESMISSPAITAKLPEIVQVVPPAAIVHVVP